MRPRDGLERPVQALSPEAIVIWGRVIGLGHKGCYQGMFTTTGYNSS